MDDALKNLDAECTTLGCALLDKNAVYSVLPLLKAQDFSLDSHRKIFHVISELANAGKPVDVLTVTDALLGKRELEVVGGAGYIASLSEKLSSELAHVTNVGHYASLILDKSRRRRAHAAAQVLLARAEDPTVTTDECFEQIAESLLAIEADSAGKSHARPIKDVLKDTLAVIENSLRIKAWSAIPLACILSTLQRAAFGLANCGQSAPCPEKARRP